MGLKKIIIGVFITAILLTIITDVCCKRGRGRSRSKSRVQIGLPITGKYRDPESDQYYNHNDVFFIFTNSIYYLKSLTILF